MVLTLDPITCAVDDLAPAAGHLRTAAGEDRGYVVDGGYFENSGAATLHDLLHALRSAPVASGPPPRFVVIYLCSDPEWCFLPTTDIGGKAAWRPPADPASTSAVLIPAT